MGVEHHGLAFAIHCHSCVTSFSIQRFFFLHQMNDAAGKKKLLEPPWVWEKGSEDSSFPFTLDEKTIEALEKVRSYRVTKKAPFPRRIVHMHF